MTDLIIHKNEKYIEEDLAYYFSDQRDVNNQIRPNQNIYSLTPDSQHFDLDFNDGKVGNLFFPFAPYSIDRIYIGISFPLFSNNWGTAFLRHLMTRVKPEGSVILPVYPEMQAGEKNFWSRSFLENNFLSRSRWKGMSNIWAENDGVMSLRIGRKFPVETKSILAFFFEEAGNKVLRRSISSNPAPTQTIDQILFNLGQRYWKAANEYAITERVIYDYFGMKRPVSLCEIDNHNGLIALESLLSNYINVSKAVSLITEDPEKSFNEPEELTNRYHSETNTRFVPVTSTAEDALNVAPSYDIVCIFNIESSQIIPNRINELIALALDKLSPGGIVIVYEEQGLSSEITQVLDAYERVTYYSSYVASKLNANEAISHYCSSIEEELVTENSGRQKAFRVIQR